MQFEYNENDRGAKMINTGKEQSENLIKDFVHNVLDDNIYSLKDFSFLNLNFSDRDKYIEDQYKNKITPKDAKIYGDYLRMIDINKYDNHNYWNNRPFEDYDTMNLARAIYYLLFYSKLPDLTWEDLVWEIKSCELDKIKRKYRGETINTFNTLINEDYYEEFFNDIDENHDLRDKIKIFLYKVFSIGNFMLLPTNKGNCSMSLNRYKGCLGDYSDRFFNHILNKDNKYINELLNENRFWYNSFATNDEIEKFISDNYLEDYFNKNTLKYESFAPYYRHRYFDNITNTKDKEIYADYINKYIDTVTELINNRADRMIIDLKKIINKES